MTIRPTPLALPGRRIGVSYESSSNLFCRDLTDGVQEAAAARGIAVIARDCAQSPQRQLADIADLLDAGVDALVISPEDPAAIGPALAAAAARGVPVVTVDRAADGPVLSHITSDNRLGGRLAADLLSAELGGQGEVAIVGRPWPGRFDAPHVTSTEQDVYAPRGLAPGEVMGGAGWSSRTRGTSAPGLDDAAHRRPVGLLWPNRLSALDTPTRDESNARLSPPREERYFAAHLNRLGQRSHCVRLQANE
jgi:hypothetical protein